MGDRQQAISYLTQIKREMLLRKEQLMRPVNKLDEELAHVTGALTILLRETEVKVEDVKVSIVPMEKLRRLSHREAVIEIARQSGGTIRAQYAKELLIRSGCMSNTKNSTNMTHNAIAQCGKFERIGRGEYRLKESRPKTESVSPDNGQLEDVARLGSLTTKTM
jgi:hypothetical protein